MGGHLTSKSKIYQIKIELRGMRPPVWRRVQVPGEMSLAELHEVVQAVMGWTDTHLHEFDVDGVRYGVPDDQWGFDGVKDESRTKLFRLAGDGGRLEYTYDFGDDWRHVLRVEKVLAPESGVRYPRCTAGRRACPPEDVGGPWGYGEFLEAIADPEHENHEDAVDRVWGPFDPARFDAGEVDGALEHLARTASAPARG